MTLSQKLISGFGLVSVITILVGVVGLIGVGNLTECIGVLENKTIPSIHAIDDIESNLKSLRIALRGLVNPMFPKQERAKDFANVDEARKGLLEAVNALESIPGKSPAVLDLEKQLKDKLKDYLSGVEIFVQRAKDLEAIDITDPIALAERIEHFKFTHYYTMFKVTNLLFQKEEFEGGEDASECEFGKWLATFKTDNEKLSKYIEDIIPIHNEFHSTIKKIKYAVKEGNFDNANMIYKTNLEPAAKSISRNLNNVREIMVGQSEQIYKEMLKFGFAELIPKQKEVLDVTGKLKKVIADEQLMDIELSKSSAKSSKIMIFAGIVFGVIIALLIGTYIAASTTRVVRRIADGLADGADQVAAASAQASSSGQSLAESSSQQAAAIEETSSAMEEIASMTRQNADNASEAERLMRETKQIVSEANASMDTLAESMIEINRASEETSKIIKTIDEIAFQTNLLALNAAVEAARAGEAGAGFAVVADEVRSLAMRAAEAAKNTAALIEATVTKAKAGMSITEQTKSIFAKVAYSTEKVSELLGEIAAASREQRDGIDQISRAVSEIDKAIQSNAANAEESASASEELNAQAEQLRYHVSELLALVNGKMNGKPKTIEITEPQRQKKVIGEALVSSIHTGNVVGKTIASAARSAITEKTTNESGSDSKNHVIKVDKLVA